MRVYDLNSTVPKRIGYFDWPQCGHDDARVLTNLFEQRIRLRRGLCWMNPGDCDGFIHDESIH